LLEPESRDDFADRTLLKGEEIQDVAPARLGYGVESV
jgi:hypothetical protein